MRWWPIMWRGPLPWAKLKVTGGSGNDRSKSTWLFAPPAVSTATGIFMDFFHVTASTCRKTTFNLTFSHRISNRPPKKQQTFKFKTIASRQSLACYQPCTKRLPPRQFSTPTPKPRGVLQPPTPVALHHLPAKRWLRPVQRQPQATPVW